MDVSPSFGERLLMARRRANFEQGELAKHVGLTRYTLGRLERGQTRQITLEVLPRLARVLGVTTDWLLGMEDGEVLATESLEDILASPRL